MDEPISSHRRARGPAAVAWALVFAAIVLGALFAMDRPQAEDTTTRGVREVVQLQLLAFQADDASKAFQLADPGIRSKFSNADEFLQMVRAQYPMVHRPASVVFLKPQGDGHMAFQKIRLTDTAGGAWLVTYLLNRQKDHRWLISACLVVPDTPRVTA
jgi:hypothetical protein